MSYSALSWSLGSNELVKTKYFKYSDNTYAFSPVSYCLFDNPTDWTTFQTFVEADGATVTTNQKANLLAYQSYAL